jgi:DNA polymerase-3 subunit gamma/tau
VVGQNHVIQTLRNAITTDRIAHAYLFSGPRGTGKTSAARLLAKAVNCLDPDLAVRPCNRCDFCQAVNQGRFLDLIEIDAASNTSVEDVRDLRDKINFSPNQGKYKVYIIDEVHMLSTAAFNALLKTLEEPPPHAIFILATTEVHKIPLTVLSRCQRHEFRRIPVGEIVAHLKSLSKQENIQVEQDALTLLARQSTGAMRDAISLLDQLASTGEVITLERAQNILGTAASQSVLDVIQALIDRQPAVGLDCIHRALDAGSDPRQFGRQIVDYLRDLLLIKSGNREQVDATPEVFSQMERHSQAFDNPELLDIIRSFNYAAVDARSAWQPSLPMEIAFVEALANRPSMPNAPEQAGSVPQPQSAPNASKASTARTQDQASQPASPPAATSSGDEQVLKKIKESWNQTTLLVRKVNPSTQGLLNSCQPVAVQEGVLYLGFSGEFVKNKMESGNHVEITRKALEQVIGLRISIRCIVPTGGVNRLPPEVESDGMVAAALRDLGGEIVDVQ